MEISQKICAKSVELGKKYVTVGARAAEFSGLEGSTKKSNGKVGQIILTPGPFVTYRILMEAGRKCKISQKEFYSNTSSLEHDGLGTCITCTNLYRPKPTEEKNCRNR